MFRPATLILLNLLAFPAGVSALEPGLPPGLDAPGRPWLEVQVESYRRDIEQEMRGSDGTFVGEQKERRYWLRGVWPAHPRLALGLRGGCADSDASRDPVPAVGAHAEVILLGTEHASISLFGGADYVHDIQYRRAGGQIGTVVIADDERTERHLEFGGGLRWNWRFDLPGGWRLLPHAGVLLTAIRADGEENFAFPDGVPVRGARRGGESEVNFEEDGIFGALAGVALRHASGPALRVEARRVDREILSAGLSWTF